MHLLPVAVFAGIAGFVFALLFGAARGELEQPAARRWRLGRRPRQWLGRRGRRQLGRQRIDGGGGSFGAAAPRRW
ncbi:MAG: hypothetical protein U1F11_04915 [Steroidobacteraceae bacterium]